MFKSTIIAQMDYIQWIENSKREDFAFDTFQTNPISSSFFCIDTSFIELWLIASIASPKVCDLETLSPTLSLYI
jgi:hypothetical protein